MNTIIKYHSKYVKFITKLRFDSIALNKKLEKQLFENI
jgi:hypothetical protein